MKPKSTFLAALAIGCANLALGAVAPDQQVPDQLDISTAIGFALQNNFSIREARERIRQQEGVIVEVRGKALPNVAAQGLYQENTESISQTFPTSTNFWQVSVTATQTLFAAGGVSSAIKNAKLVRESAVLDLQASINAALLDVRTRFYAVLLAQDQLKVQEQNIALLRSQLKDSTNRFTAGTVSSFDKLRAQVSLANGQVPLITARNTLRISVEQLRQSLGFTSHLSAAPDEKMPGFIGELKYVPSHFELQGCLESARANRPELARLATLRQANETQVTVAKSNYYPNLGLTGGWEAEKAPFAISGGSSSAVNGWRIGLQSQWNIFDGASTSGRVAQARSVLEQSRLTLDEQTLAIDVGVRQSFSSWQQAVELTEATQQTVGQAEESLRQAKARYQAGSATQLDVLQAETDLTQARNNLVQANYTYAVAVAQLREAMGLPDENIVH